MTSSSSGTTKTTATATTGISAPWGNGLTCEEVEEVLRDEDSEIEVSRSSGRPTAFGWTSSGERIAVVFEEMSEVRAWSTPFRRTPCRRRELRKGRSNEGQASHDAPMDRGGPRPA